MKYDAIIIGGGHNGLVTACYLAKAGRKVLVLERRDIVGGAAITEEIAPGFHSSRLSYVNSLFRPQIIRDLRLENFGLEMLPRNPSSFSPFPDGRSLTLGPDQQQTFAEISKFSKRDAAAYGAYEKSLEKIAIFIEKTLDITPPNPLSNGPGNLWNLLTLGLQARGLGDDLHAMVRLLSGSGTDLLERWFESEQLKVTLATDAVIGAMVAPSTPGSAYVLLHHVMGTSGGERGVWAYIRGGMGGLSNALATSARDLGVEIRTGVAVSQVKVREQQAVGVVTEKGDEIDARLVISNADPKVTFLKLTPADALPADFRQEVEQLDFSSATIKINLALSELPNFTAQPGANGPQHRGTIHISPTMEYVERAYDDARYGRPSENPVIEMTLPSALDDSIAPAGKHVAGLFVQYAPFKLREGNWDDRKDAFADRCIDIVTEYAPNFKNSIIARDVISPLDMEREFSLTGGNIFHGAMTLPQMFCFRPVAGWGRYRTPLKGLYMCGAGTHPGGGVMGACGANAAREILKDS